jgi:hypothetical protein
MNGRREAAAAPLSVLITAPWAHRLGGAEEMLCTFLEHVDRQRLHPHVVLLTDGPLVQYLRDRDVPTTVIEAGRLRHVHLRSEVDLPVAFRQPLAWHR